MRKEMLLGAALWAAEGCAPENQLQGIDKDTCWADVTGGVVNRNITARPSSRPDFNSNNGEFDELWETKGNTANRVENLVALASNPRVHEGEYTNYDSDKVEVLPELESVPLGGEDIDYPVGFMTTVYVGENASLEGAYMDIAVVSRDCRDMHGWGSFSFYCEDDNCWPDFKISRDAFLDYDGQMKY